VYQIKTLAYGQGFLFGTSGLKPAGSRLPGHLKWPILPPKAMPMAFKSQAIYGIHLGCTGLIRQLGSARSSSPSGNLKSNQGQAFLEAMASV
jgi:hypothetical protein